MSFSILVPLCLHFSISVCERTVVRGKPTIVVFQERAIQRRATPQGHRAEECLGRVLKWEAGGQWREAMPRNCFSEDTPEALWRLWSVRRRKAPFAWWKVWRSLLSEQVVGHPKRERRGRVRGSECLLTAVLKGSLSDWEGCADHRQSAPRWWLSPIGRKKLQLLFGRELAGRCM